MDIQKSIQDGINSQRQWVEDIQKGKPAHIGETRIWGDKKVQKQVAGWVELKGVEKPVERGGVYDSPEFKLAEKVKSILASRGVNMGFSVSDTDYGKSMYFTVYGDNYEPKLKVRISDHSVSNYDRVFNEQHESSKSDPNRIADDIEIVMHPERFDKIQTGSRYYNKIDNNWVFDEVVDGKAWVKSYNSEATESLLDGLNPKEHVF